MSEKDKTFDFSLHKIMIMRGCKKSNSGAGDNKNQPAIFVSIYHARTLPSSLDAPCFLGFFVGLVVTVPGTAKPLNSQLQLSHSKLYRKKIFEKKDVGR
jgi:hypothetical protein